MEEIKGYVDHIIFRNATNGYTVMNFVADGLDVTVTGAFPEIAEGENYILQGELVDHPTYGEQFKMTTYVVTAPEDEEAMKRYLGSGAIKGLGPALASRIVKKFKKDTFRIVEEEPERLAEIKGISQRMAMEISDQMMEKKDLRDAMVFLGKYGISTSLAVKIYNHYGPTLYRIVEENPYRMAEEVRGIGFKIADEIASRVGIHTDSDFRIQSGLIYTLNMASVSGNTFLPREMLVHTCANLLGVNPEYIEPHVDNLEVDRKLIIREGEVYTRTFYKMEERSADMLLQLCHRDAISESELETDIARVEQDEEIQLDEKQRLAVETAAENGIMVLTGGPGTGKTTTIRAMISYFENQNLDIMLAAPTGRATKRMSETTGYEAKTIHRLLEVSGGMMDDGELPGENHSMFAKNQENPLEADVFIIDEVSMVDIPLFYALLKAIPEGAKLILVGDVNQLPSVGPGNVLRDIIQSEKIPVVVLDKIFRQASESDIVVNAHKINNGEKVVLDNQSKDFFFLKRSRGDIITSVMLSVIMKKLPPYVGVDPMEIQVLTPTRKGILGVDSLNQILQEHLNPPDGHKIEIQSGDRIFREGDKVMQIKNNYQMEWEVPGKYNIPVDSGLGVFNGDTGYIKRIDSFAKLLVVEYDEGRCVKYPLNGLDELELAYAITIHKSQGSEYPAIVIPLLQGPVKLMNRNLLYTAVTRAKKCVMLIGDEQVFQNMISNTTEQRRYSGLRDRIVEIAEALEE
ncbi:MAG: ATP-dependent RecD-like DNA helicase [Lachnospiraceae bacterium]|nr:ATP-dependent RecD-like DNA helicase [Lachnospiraceae bacterium]